MLKFFLTLFNIFEHIQIFLTKVKSDILRYKFAYLSMVKIFDHNIEHSQKFWKQPNTFLN